MATTEELACVYSCLVLHDNQHEVTADKITSLLKSANLDVEPFWPGLFAKAAETLDLKSLISNIGAGSGAGPAANATDAQEDAAPAAAAGGTDKKKKEEEEEEEDDDMGFGLFD